MLQSIHEALSRNDSSRAVALAREGLAQLPSNPDLLHLLAVALLRQGETPEAEEALERAIVLAPERAAFYVLRAELAFARRQLPTALDDLDRAIKQDPNHLGAYLLQSRIALARGDVGTADASLKRAQRVNAEHPGVLRLAGQIALARNEPDAAISALNRALELRPQSLELYVELAMAYQRRGLPAVAVQALRRAQQIDPRAESVQRMLVQMLLEAHETEAARDELRRVLEKRPQDAGAWGLMGEIEGALQQFEAAEKATLRSLEIAPAQPTLIERLMRYWASQGQIERARERLDALLKKQPTSSLLWNARFGIDAAEPGGAEVLARWRAAAPAAAAEIDEAEAQRAEALGELDEAERLALRALEAEPQRVAAALVLVRIDRERAPDKAIERLRALTRQRLPIGLKRSLHALLGSLLDAQNACSEALAVWREGQAIDPASQEPLPGLPLPGFPPAGPALAADAERGASMRLLWPLPGTAAISVFNALGPVAPVLTDRFGAEARNDGLGPLRPEVGHHGEQGAEKAWRANLQARGWPTEGVIDALPHCDPALLSAVPEARLLALVADPRDLLLSWLAFGSVQDYMIDKSELLPKWLGMALQTLIDRRKSEPQRTALLRMEDLREAPEQALAAALQFLGIDGQPGPYRGAAGANPNALELPVGRWRAYRKELEQAFAELTPLAVELGYPAD
jgi:tetratricopeptide (TPR) repeat protein